jgi:hypothetical protein
MSGIMGDASPSLDEGNSWIRNDGLGGQLALRTQSEQETAYGR